MNTVEFRDIIAKQESGDEKIEFLRLVIKINIRTLT